MDEQGAGPRAGSWLDDSDSAARIRAYFVMACLSGDVEGIRAHAAVAFSILGAPGKRHCVFACIRSGSVAALKALVAFGFTVPRQALAYIPSDITPKQAYDLGIELLALGASARQCSWTGGTVVMTILPHCWSQHGVHLLRRVIEYGGADAHLPEHSPARRLESSRPGHYALVRAALTGRREWATAATFILGRIGAMRAAARFAKSDNTRRAIKALVDAGCDPRKHARFITAVGSVPSLEKGPTKNPYIPARVKHVAFSLFAAMSRRDAAHSIVLPYDVLLLIVDCLPWD